MNKIIMGVDQQIIPNEVVEFIKQSFEIWEDPYPYQRDKWKLKIKEGKKELLQEYAELVETVTKLISSISLNKT